MKLLGLLLLGLIVFMVLNKQRVFLRDPVGSVMRDGVEQRDAKVLINYSNDVLVDDQSGGKHRVYLVQHWNKVASFPTSPLKCLNGLACLTDADQATAAPIVVGDRGRRAVFAGVSMTDRRVEFVDEDGALVAVNLRSF